MVDEYPEAAIGKARMEHERDQNPGLIRKAACELTDPLEPGIATKLVLKPAPHVPDHQIATASESQPVLVDDDRPAETDLAVIRYGNQAVAPRWARMGLG